VDNILILNGTILPNQPSSVNDLWTTSKQLGDNFSGPDLLDNCGTGYGKLLSPIDLFSVGTYETWANSNMALLDTAYLVAREQSGHYDWRNTLPVARLQSAWSGIQVDVYSDQEAFQVYSCNSQNGSRSLTPFLGQPPTNIPKQHRLPSSEISSRLLQRHLLAARHAVIRLHRHGS